MRSLLGAAALALLTIHGGASGQAAKQVAHELGCSASTVHNHLHHIYRKLDVSGQAQALLLARERGWV